MSASLTFPGDAVQNTITKNIRNVKFEIIKSGVGYLNYAQKPQEFNEILQSIFQTTEEKKLPEPKPKK